MSTVFHRLVKPEYLLRPSQIIRRLNRTWARRIPQSAVVRLPWGLPLEVVPRETIGGGIWRLGVHELTASEVLWRLMDPGECAADIGANIGYFTSLMSRRAGATGSVLAFEPHPEMQRRLTGNIARWTATAAGRVEVFPCALSDFDGEADLYMPTSFERNTGTAFVPSSAPPADLVRIAVTARRMDSLVAPGDSPVVVKIDVEGHEARVFAGAGALLAAGHVRDLLFEEHRPYPAESHRLLQQRGYTLYRVNRGILGPRLESPDSVSSGIPWEAPCFLATLDSTRAEARLRKGGWMCLSSSST